MTCAHGSPTYDCMILGCENHYTKKQDSRSSLSAGGSKVLIERYYGNDSRSPEQECSGDILGKEKAGLALVSHTAIPREPTVPPSWSYFIHAVFRAVRA